VIAWLQSRRRRLAMFVLARSGPPIVSAPCRRELRVAVEAERSQTTDDVPTQRAGMFEPGIRG